MRENFMYGSARALKVKKGITMSSTQQGIMSVGQN
jgi:hypothetical protein